jgi:putative ABC transport system permease protein
VRSFSRLLRVDPDVDVEHVLTGRVTLPSARYPAASRPQFYERLIADIAALPGVEAAAAASYVPAGARGLGLGRVFLLQGQPEPPASSDHPASWNVITPDYFRAMGIRLIKGRALTSRDTASSTPVMVINETMARRVFGNAEPLGARMRSWRDENLLREVVGVVSDVRYNGLADEDRSLVYVPHTQNTWGSLTLVVRTAGDPASLAAPVRRVVAAHDRDLAIADVNPLRVAAARSIAGPRFGAWLFALFAAAAAVLAAIGIYGVMSYAVARRSHEMAVRLALGAAPAAVSALVIRHGLRLTSIGAVLGLAGAYGAGTLMERILFGVQPHDPLTFITVPALLCGIAVLACALPARRAALIEPLAALRNE